MSQIIFFARHPRDGGDLVGKELLITGFQSEPGMRVRKVLGDNLWQPK
jgi:hypothetical protein